MPLHPGWPDILLRLGLTVLAGAVLGFDRETRGHAAGLRTTVLVGLAAAVAMVQANLLLPLDGKPPGSFVNLDLMRLPLGVLTGVGFIGGGAILKKGGAITGVTTAATLWIVTAIGLCFGGGQTGVGLVATGLAWLVLYALKRVELSLPRLQDARLALLVAADAPPPDLDPLVARLGYRTSFVGREAAGENVRWTFAVRWKQAQTRRSCLDLLEAVSRTYAVESLAIPQDAED